MLGDTLEQGPRRWEVPGSFVEVRKGVGPPEVVGLDPLRPSPTLGENGNGVVNPALVSEVSCRHYSTLSDKAGIGRHLAKLIPQGRDFCVVSECSVAIGENSVLVD